MKTKKQTRIDWRKFKSWLKRQPRRRSFVFTDNCGCMVHAFLKESFGVDAFVITRRILLRKRWITIPSEVSDPVLVNVIDNRVRCGDVLRDLPE